MNTEELRKELLGLTLQVEVTHIAGNHGRHEGTIVNVEKYAVMHNRYKSCIVRVDLECENGEIVNLEFLYNDVWTLVKFHTMEVSFGDREEVYKYELKAP